MNLPLGIMLELITLIVLTASDISSPGNIPQAVCSGSRVRVPGGAPKMVFFFILRILLVHTKLSVFPHNVLMEHSVQLTLNLPFGSVVFSICACRTNPLYHLRIGKIPPAVVCKGPGFE